MSIFDFDLPFVVTPTCCVYDVDVGEDVERGHSSEGDEGTSRPV